MRVLYLVESAPLDMIVSHTEFVTSPGGDPGLRGEYFDNEELKGEPALVRTDERIDFRWGEGSYRNGGPVDHFAVRWTGYFVPQMDDDYRFYASADDGVRLYLNDELVIDDWRRHGETLNTYVKHLEAGKANKLRLEYFENVGTATMRFGISATSTALGAEKPNNSASCSIVVPSLITTSPSMTGTLHPASSVFSWEAHPGTLSFKESILSLPGRRIPNPLMTATLALLNIRRPAILLRRRWFCFTSTPSVGAAAFWQLRGCP